MPKIAVKQISDSASFDSLVTQIAEAKQNIKGWQDHQKKLEEELISLFSDVDSASDYEGSEAIESEKYRIKLVYKLTRSVDKEKADEILRGMGESPEHLFNVKYEYSSTLFRALDDEHRKTVLNSMTAKRAKTSVEITDKEQKNGKIDA